MRDFAAHDYKAVASHADSLNPRPGSWAFLGRPLLSGFLDTKVGAAVAAGP